MKKILLLTLATIFAVMGLLQAAHADCSDQNNAGTIASAPEILPSAPNTPGFTKNVKATVSAAATR